MSMILLVSDSDAFVFRFCLFLNLLLFDFLTLWFFILKYQYIFVCNIHQINYSNSPYMKVTVAPIHTVLLYIRSSCTFSELNSKINLMDSWSESKAEIRNWSKPYNDYSLSAIIRYSRDKLERGWKLLEGNMVYLIYNVEFQVFHSKKSYLRSFPSMCVRFVHRFFFFFIFI